MKLFTRTPEPVEREESYAGTDQDLFAEIGRLEAANRRRRKLSTEQRLLLDNGTILGGFFSFH